MRVPRTFAFVDLSGFTKFTEMFGDEHAARLLSGFRAVTREVASARGVRIAKWLGDGCMVVGVARDDVISFALELDQRAVDVCNPLGLRVGISSGLALLFEGDDYVGSAVNLAARLCDAAVAGEILMPSESAGDLPAGTEALPHEPLKLHGLPGMVQVVQLSGTPRPSSVHDTGELWTRPPFVA